MQRKRHAATLLDLPGDPNDGTVLVEGGASIPNGMLVDPGTPTAEVYDPTTGLWTINTPRRHEHRPHGAGRGRAGRWHRARDWRHLDDDAIGPISSSIPRLSPPWTAYFMPGSDILPLSWILIGGRWRGKVLEIGGASTGNSVFGGLEQALDTVEIYDPSTATFSLFGTMTEPRQNNTATLLSDGRILIAGGVSSPAISHHRGDRSRKRRYASPDSVTNCYSDSYAVREFIKHLYPGKSGNWGQCFDWRLHYYGRDRAEECSYSGDWPFTEKRDSANTRGVS